MQRLAIADWQEAGLPTFQELRPQFFKIPPDLWVPDSLGDTQSGWQVKLLKASIRSEWLGYILVSGPRCSGCEASLWSIAGAARREVWDRHSRHLVKIWQSALVASLVVWYFPPLIESLDEQLKAKRSKHSQFRNRAGGVARSASTSDSGFDFDLGSKKSMIEIPEGVKKRNERERRARLRDAEKRGLRDFSKHPREPWELEGVLEGVERVG